MRLQFQVAVIASNVCICGKYIGIFYGSEMQTHANVRCELAFRTLHNRKADERDTINLLSGSTCYHVVNFTYFTFRTLAPASFLEE